MQRNSIRAPRPGSSPTSLPGPHCAGRCQIERRIMRIRDAIEFHGRHSVDAIVVPNVLAMHISQDIRMPLRIVVTKN